MSALRLAQDVRRLVFYTIKMLARMIALRVYYDPYASVAQW
jgi:hypothetical protein